jgi:AcrR family transcriptional regulator
VPTVPATITTRPETVRPPRQERSRATLNRILEATEALLRERLLDDVTLGDILERSRVSVGAFYGRFPNKEALVPCLYDRYDRWVTDGARRILDPGRWRGLSLHRRSDLFFRYAVRIYRANRGLMRALTLHARAHPEAVSGPQRGNRADLYERAASLFLERRSQMSHPDPELAVRTGLLMIGSTLREKILHDGSPHSRAVLLTDAQLSREMSRAFLQYVGARRRRRS